MKQTSKWFVFGLVAVAQFMVVLDNSIVNVALKDIEQDLGFTATSLQWIVTAYTLMFGGFLLLGGRLADLYGRRKMLIIGLIGFSIFSLLTGLATSPTMMIVMRGLQGLSAALMSPAALSTVLATFQDAKERNQALGYWALVSTAGGAIGLLLGGALTQFVNWRWNFFINVPVGIALVVGLLRAAPPMKSDLTQRKLDIPGAALITTGLVTLVLGISQAPEWGWLAPTTLGSVAAGLALIAAFIYNESRHKQPLIPLDFFKKRNIVGGNLMIMPVFAVMLGQFYLLSLYFQQVMQFTPFQTGLAFLPFPIIVGFLSPRMSGLVSRYGFKRFLVAGPFFILAGLAWLSFLPVDGTYWLNLLPAIILLPIGVGLTIMPIISAATSGVPANRSGLASGTINTTQQLGGALGLSILTGITSSVAAANTSGGAIAAQVQGYRAAFVVAIGLILLALVVAITVMKTPRDDGSGTDRREAAPNVPAEVV